MKPEQFLESVLIEFRSLKKVAEKAVQQISDKDFFSAPDSESNSIAVLMKHLAGNMRSRWTDFLTSDGEKPDRNRDSEFVTEGVNRAEIMQKWEAGWSSLFQALEPLKPEDLDKTVYVRGKAQSAYNAIFRQLTHYAVHVGQILYLAKHYAETNWQTLSVPKGKSEDYKKQMWGK